MRIFSVFFISIFLFSCSGNKEIKEPTDFEGAGHRAEKIFNDLDKELK